MKRTEKFIRKFGGENQSILREYFYRTQNYYQGNRDAARFLQDEQKCISVLLSQGDNLAFLTERLSFRADNDFFRKNDRAYALDTAAKLYPLVMGRYRASVFRLSAWLKEDVVPEILQCALNRVRPRFPLFSVVVKKGLFWHYLDGFNGHCRVMQDKDLPCYQIRLSGLRSVPFRVVYYKNRISVEFFHALTDGTGGLIFLKSLLGEYFRICGVRFLYSEDVLNVTDPSEPEELVDGFEKIVSTLSPGGMSERKAVALNGKISFRRARAYHFVFEADKLRSAAASKSVTVTALLAGYILLATRDCSQGDGCIRIQIPVNVRKFYGLKTLSNCAMFTCVEMDRQKVTNDLEVFSEADRQIREGAGKENTERSVVKAVKLVKALHYVPLMFKRPAARLYDTAITNHAFTHTLSNLGMVKLPKGISEKVEMLDFVIGSPVKNSGYLSMITFGGKAVLSYTTSNQNKEFEEKLLSYTEADGLTARVFGGQNYAD